MMIIRGGALNSAITGNNLHFQPDHVRALSMHTPIDFMVDHSTSVRDSAGTVEFTSAYEFPNQDLDRSDYILNFKASLSPEYPGYEAATQYIAALRRDGRVPNVSVSIIASDLEVDMEANKITMVGPYELRHLALVDKGAMGPTDGVGVFDVETPPSLAHPGASAQDRLLTAHLSATPPGAPQDASPALSIVSMTTTVNLSNSDDLVARFIDKHGIDSPETLALGRLLGRDASDDELEPNPLLADDGSCRYGSNPDGTCKEAPSSGHSEQESDQNASETPEGTYVPSQPQPIEDSPESDQGEQPMTDKPETTTVPEPVADAPSEEPTANTPSNMLSDKAAKLEKELAAAKQELADVEAEASAKDSLVAEFASRIDALEKAGSEEKERRLNEARNRVIALMSEDEDATVLDGMGEAQLAFIEGRLSEATKRPSYLPSSPFTSATEKSKFEKNFEDAQEWHKSVYIGGDA